tara:strand:+ start:398 stop:667 length:270 start_codon:yes stop_codon:yes gene_type:complete
MKTQEEIEKMANEFSKDYIKTTNNSILQSSFKLEVGYIKGYIQCQEDNKDKKCTIEDVINIVDNVSKNWFRCYSHNDKKEHILKITKQD